MQAFEDITRSGIRDMPSIGGELEVIHRLLEIEMMQYHILLEVD